jgi:O-antigen/teichoic acid export membrane protein
MAPPGSGSGRSAAPLVEFMTSTSAYWMAMLAVGVFNLGFNLVAARALAPAAYGELAAIIALVNLFLVAVGAITRTVTGMVARTEDAGLSAWMLRRGTVWLAVAGAAAALLVGAESRPIAAALHLDTPAWVLIAALALVPGNTGAVTTGILQGFRLFPIAGGVNLVAAVAKFTALLLLLRGGWGVTGGAAATLVEVTVVWLGTAAVLRRLLRGVTPRAGQLAAEYRNLLALPVSLTVARLVFFNLDILMARHYLGARDAGLFAALGVTGRIIAYATGALPPVIYPYLVRHRAEPRLAARCLALALGGTAAFGGVAIAIFYVAPGPVVRALFGSAFVQIAPYVAWYGLGFLLYALTYVLLHYLLAEESWWVWVYAVGGSAAEAATLMAFHGGIGELTRAVAAFFGLMFALTAIHTGVRVFRRKPEVGVGLAAAAT